MDKFDVCIAGAGVVGLAIAYQLSQSKNYSGSKIVLLDSESDFGRITSSRNSEVIHAGIYYFTGSLKAHLCVKGKSLLYNFLEQNNLPHKKIGKLIVAQNGEEDNLLHIRESAEKNNVKDLQWIDHGKLKRLEPALKASAALYSPSTGIVDSHSYMSKLLEYAEERGVYFAPYTKVTKVERPGTFFLVTTHITDKPNQVEEYQFQCNKFINSTGLNAQELAENIEGVDTALIPKLHLCKGDYFSYTGKSPFNHLIYPLPENNHTGLGVHSTLDIAGQTRFGPDTEYLKSINYDVDSDKCDNFASSIKSYFPKIQASHLAPGYSGIRPKIAGPGEMEADFCIQGPKINGVKGLVQLFGMESPALTASLAIAEYVETLLEPQHS